MGSAASLKKDIFYKTPDVWQKCKESHRDDELNTHLKEVYDYLDTTDEISPLAEKVKRQSKVGKRLVSSGCLSILSEKLIALLQEEEQDDQDGGTVDRGDGEVLNHVLWSVAIATEICDQVCQVILENRDLLTRLVSKLKAMVQLFECSSNKPLKDSNSYRILLGSLRIVHSVSVYVESKEVEGEDQDNDNDKEASNNLQTADPLEADLVQATISALKKCVGIDDVIKLKALSALACLVTDDYEEVFTSDVIHFLLLHFSLAMLDKNHQSCYCSAAAILCGLRHLLRANNKARLESFIQNGVSVLLAKGLRDAKTEEEKQACLYSLWLLSFNKKCLKDMAAEESLVDLFKKMKKARRYSSRADEILKRIKKFSNRHKRATSQQKHGYRTQPESVTHGHVMLSYQSADRETVLKIRDFLRSNGIETWMDVDDMTKKKDLITQRMAEAVEEAAVVIIAVSKNYFNSRNCKREANYAYRLEKEIIPLKLQEDYTATGWLGFIESTEFFYKFTNKKQFEQDCNKLLHAVQTVLKPSTGSEKHDSARERDKPSVQQPGPVESQTEGAANKERSTPMPSGVGERPEETDGGQGGHREEEQKPDNRREWRSVEHLEKEEKGEEADHKAEDRKEEGGSEHTSALHGEGSSDEGRVAEGEQETECGPGHTSVSGSQRSDEDKGPGHTSVSGSQRSDEDKGPGHTSVSGSQRSDEDNGPGHTSVSGSQRSDEDKGLGHTSVSGSQRSDEDNGPGHTSVSGGQRSDEDKEKDGSEDAPVSDHGSSDKKEEVQDKEVNEDEVEDTYGSAGESSDKENVTGKDNEVRGEQTKGQNLKRTEPFKESDNKQTVHTDQPTGEISASQNLSELSPGSPSEEPAVQHRQSNYSSDSSPTFPKSRGRSVNGVPVKRSASMTEGRHNRHVTREGRVGRSVSCISYQSPTFPKSRGRSVNGVSVKRSASMTEGRHNRHVTREGRVGRSVSCISYQNTRRKDSRPKAPQGTTLSSSRQKLLTQMEEFGLKNKELEALSEKDLRFLVRLKSEAPEVYYKSLRRDLHLRTVSEMALFSEAMSGSMQQKASGRSLTVVHYTF